MLTIFWSTRRPVVKDWLPTNASFNSTYFCEVIIPHLASTDFPDQTGQCKRRIYLHMDNVRHHNSRKSLQCVTDRKFKRMSHPPYSPDIAPNDCYLFGTVKQCLQTCEGRSFEELQENVDQILRFIRLNELKATMRGWMECLWRVIALGGEYA
jgi:histone-lysine N-methyltransferase SETMAR